MRRLWNDPGTNLVQMILPAAVVALSGAAVLARLARSEMLEVLRQDYVRTAYAKGLSGRVVILRHALRNAMIPLITLIGLVFAEGVAGSVIVEQIFGMPGMGRLLVDVHLLERPAGGAALDAVLRHGLRPRQPRRGPQLRRLRSPDPVPVSAAEPGAAVFDAYGVLVRPLAAPARAAPPASASPGRIRAGDRARHDRSSPPSDR